MERAEAERIAKGALEELYKFRVQQLVKLQLDGFAGPIMLVATELTLVKELADTLTQVFNLGLDKGLGTPR